MQSSIRVAALEMNSRAQSHENLACFEWAARKAADGGAQLLVTPECSNFLAADGKQRAVSEQQDLLLNSARSLALELGLEIVLGSLLLREQDHWVNRQIFLDKQGQIIARYDKIHLFDAQIDDGQDYHESATFKAGARAVVTKRSYACFGHSICFDLRFPQLYQSLAKAGAQVLLTPAAFTQTTGQAHWQYLLRARAIETGCFVIAPAQVGLHDDGRQTYGHAMIIDPWGRILAQSEQDNQAQELRFDDKHGQLIFAQLDFSALTATRRALPLLDLNRAFQEPD